MAEFFVIISVFALIGLVIGIPFPKLSLFWYPGNRSRFNVLRFYLLLFVLSFLCFALVEGS